MTSQLLGWSHQPCRDCDLRLGGQRVTQLGRASARVGKPLPSERAPQWATTQPSRTTGVWRSCRPPTIGRRERQRHSGLLGYRNPAICNGYSHGEPATHSHSYLPGPRPVTLISFEMCGQRGGAATWEGQKVNQRLIAFNINGRRPIFGSRKIPQLVPFPFPPKNDLDSEREGKAGRVVSHVYGGG